MMWEEWKKIWRPGRILLLVLLGYLFYAMFLEDYAYRLFSADPQTQGMLAVSAELTDRYGTSLSEEEITEVYEYWLALCDQMDMYVRGFELAKKYGLDGYAAYKEFYTKTVENVGEAAADQNEAYMDAMRIENYLNSEATGNILGRAQAARHLLDCYETAWEFAADPDPTLLPYPFMYAEWTGEDIENMIDTFYGEDALWQNLLPAEVPMYTWSYMSSLCIWMCLSVCLLLSPLLVTDRMNRMQSLQYSSKRGRSVYRIQFGTAMLSAFVLSTVNLCVFLGVFKTTGIGAFWENRMYSFINIEGWICMMNWTYGTWYRILVVLAYLVALGVAALAFVLSRSSANYIVMLLKMIPMFLAAAFICLFLFWQAFYYDNFIYSSVPVPYVEAYSAVLLFLTGLACFCLSWRKLRVADC